MQECLCVRMREKNDTMYKFIESLHEKKANVNDINT